MASNNTAPGVAADAMIWKHWCETCEGVGHYDATLGSDSQLANPKQECQDCDGKGYWIPRSPPAIEVGSVYLVHTGLIHEGESLYTRHDICPPLCDAEKLYTAPPLPAQVQEAENSRQLVIYLDGDPIDVGQFYRAKGFEKLPPTPTMSGAEIRACGWKKNNYQMYLMCPEDRPSTLIGDAQAIPVIDGMRFWCIPPATMEMS